MDNKNSRKKDLDDFWEKNYPNVKEEKRIMWLD